MNTQEHYQSDLLFYFDGRPQELALYEDLFQAMSAAFPDACVTVQKSQISFYGRHLFAAASLPVRRKKGWPEHCLMVTFGLDHRENHSRITVATEPYPNRWTHHTSVADLGELDEELMGWLYLSKEFSGRRRRRKS